MCVVIDTTSYKFIVHKIHDFTYEFHTAYNAMLTYTLMYVSMTL